MLFFFFLREKKSRHRDHVFCCIPRRMYTRPRMYRGCMTTHYPKGCIYTLQRMYDHALPQRMYMVLPDMMTTHYYLKGPRYYLSGLCAFSLHMH